MIMGKSDASKKGTFIVKVEYCQNESWQGQVIWAEENRSVRFRSALELMKLIRQGEYCKAEDMLFDNLEYSDKYIELASDFYQRLNSLSDEQLELGGFSRDEIYDGYIEIMALLGVPVDVFGQADRSEY